MFYSSIWIILERIKQEVGQLADKLELKRIAAEKGAMFKLDILLTKSFAFLQ